MKLTFGRLARFSFVVPTSSADTGTSLSSTRRHSLTAGIALATLATSTPKATSTLPTASRNSSSTVRQHHAPSFYPDTDHSSEGFQVAPAELEGIIIGREDVADVCVVGVYSEADATELPRAYIVLAPGQTASDEKAKEIAEWLASRVAPPKKLRGGVRFVKEIPKSAAGKILRRILRDEANKENKAPKAKL